MSNFRKLKIEDLITPVHKDKNTVCKNSTPIQKNQETFGHKKRIKP
jgi:hypothetical protein